MASGQTVIILVMHGEPPRDFPREELGRFFRLQAELMTAAPDRRQPLKAAYEQLEARLRSWPRGAANDPFFQGARAIASELARQTGLPVIVAFNEFCSPDLDEAIDQAAQMGAGRVVVVTPMMTPGGRHSEVEIPAALARARQRYPGLTIEYGWPVPVAEVAELLALRVRQVLAGNEGAAGGLHPHGAGQQEADHRDDHRGEQSQQ